MSDQMFRVHSLIKYLAYLFPVGGTCRRRGNTRPLRLLLAQIGAKSDHCQMPTNGITKDDTRRTDPAVPRPTSVGLLGVLA